MKKFLENAIIGTILLLNCISFAVYSIQTFSNRSISEK